MERITRTSEHDRVSLRNEKKQENKLSINDVPAETFSYDTTLLGLSNNDAPAQMKSEDEELQMKPEEELQMKEEEELQMKPEEEELQMKQQSALVDREDEKKTQLKKVNTPTQPASNGSSKTAMPEHVQAKMESSFGTDFSNVNIHKDSSSATQMGAQAYAQGNDVHFAPGKYNPNTQGGQELLGHELAHVVQQRQGRVNGTQNKGGANINNDPSLENEADVMGAKAAKGQPAKVSGKGSGVQKSNDTQTYNYFVHKYTTWVQKQIDSIQDIGIMMGLEKKSSVDDFKVPEFVSLILGFTPVGKYVGVGKYILESLVNGAVSLATKNSQDIVDFYHSFRQNQDKLLETSKVDNTWSVFNQTISGGGDFNSSKLKIDNLFDVSLPQSSKIQKAFMVGWVDSTEDINTWGLESDFSGVRGGGYLYMDLHWVHPYNENSWIIQSGPFIDDIELPGATNKVLQKLYGENTPINKLPFEIQIQIDQIAPAGYHFSNPLGHTAKLVKHSTGGVEATWSNQVWETPYGNNALSLSWFKSKKFPTLKDLKID